MKIAILLCCLGLEAWAQSNRQATITMAPPAAPAQPRRVYMPRGAGHLLRLHSARTHARALAGHAGKRGAALHHQQGFRAGAALATDQPAV